MLTSRHGEGTEAVWTTAAGVPDADGAISGARCQAVGGGIESQTPHSIPMAFQDVAQHAWVWAGQEEIGY